MNWYAAHLITYVKFLDGIQNTYPLWENVVLIGAETDDEALQEAERMGREQYERLDHEFLHEGRPATWAFAGIRKLITCQQSFDTASKERELNGHPTHGTEITYSEMEVASQEALHKLVHGEPVTVLYEQ